MHDVVDARPSTHVVQVEIHVFPSGYKVAVLGRFSSLHYLPPPETQILAEFYR